MLKTKCILVVIFCTYSFVYCASPVVKTDKGTFVGTTYTLPNGRVVLAFHGIPYAAPPTGNRRFQAPMPAPLCGTYNATYNRDVCLQIHHASNISVILGDEDCLHLNVFTPKLPKHSDHLMPVLINIHGGAFMFGNGINTYPESLMASDDVVFVTINYRLGVLGFFTANDELAPGNYGLKDQVAALRWVKKNIHLFGGDPNKVTLFGNSAGGVSVHYHFFSPLSEGLFQQGISSSGAVLTPWALPKNITEKSIQLAALLGCPTSSTSSMLECLRKKPGREIVEATNHFLMWRYCPFTPFGPVVEPAGRNAFISESPHEMLKNKKVKNLPWMIGVVKEEGLYPGADIVPHDAYLKELNDGWNEIAPNLLMYNFSVSESDKDRVSAAVKKFYFGNKAISKETTKELIQVLGDRLYYDDITDALQLHNAAVSNDVYCYNFVYRGELSPYVYVFTRDNKDYGIAHGDDQFYIANDPEEYPSKKGKDVDMAKFVTSAVVAFMNTGDPNTGTMHWKPVSKDGNIKCLTMCSPSDNEMQDMIWSKERSEFWKNLLPSEYSSSKSSPSSRSDC